MRPRTRCNAADVYLNVDASACNPPQTFQDELLALCGRAHDAADVFRAVEAVHAAGVPSWSLDLMSGLPQASPNC